MIAQNEKERDKISVRVGQCVERYNYRLCFCFQAEDGIRDLVRSRGLGDVYKRQSLGYSHNIIFDLPKEIKVATAQEKGKNPTITLESNDKQLLGQVCAKLRSLRKPEPYKGKGVKFAGEVLRRKAGKAAGK